MYQLDCSFCDKLVQTQDTETLKSHAKTHLTESHAEEVRTGLSDRYDEVPCKNDCGYVLTIDGVDMAELECPHCEHENFSPLLERYVYWQLTEQ